MISHEPVAPPAASAVPYDAPIAATFDADFNTRWDAWVARGRVHERKGQRTILVWGGVLALGAAVVYAFLLA
jgi:hypothetical protein